MPRRTASTSRDCARNTPRVSERPFDSAWKFARVTVQEDGRLVSYLKGAPEVLLDRCTLSAEDRESWMEKADAYAREGFRVLAVAWAEGETEDIAVAARSRAVLGSAAGRSARRRSRRRRPPASASS